jgi:hypothetical protein
MQRNFGSMPGSDDRCSTFGPMVFLKWHLEGHLCLRSASASGAELSRKVYLCAVANRRPESVTVELPTPRQEIADDFGLRLESVTKQSLALQNDNNETPSATTQNRTESPIGSPRAEQGLIEKGELVTPHNDVNRTLTP